MSEFNLIDEPWIPCIDLEGNNRELGIRETLMQARELREICDDSPLVTLAIHRLLLAILYRVFEGPTGIREWKEIYQGGSFQNDPVRAYLNKCYGRFYLFDEDYPFYQMGHFETKSPISVNRLATEIASGNNATLFDHGNDDTNIEWTPNHTVKQLLACQAFALGFGRSSNAWINGIEESIPYSTDAIALRGMNIWIQDTSLFHTLMVNLIPGIDLSAPPWELDNPNQYRDKLQGKNRLSTSSFGTVDRFTWQSRLVKLIPDKALVSKMYFTQGRSADKNADDPMKLYRSSREEGVSALSLSSAKASWRDTHTILLIPENDSNERRPECFNIISSLKDENIFDSSHTFITHIVGLAAAPNKAGKFLLWRHERLPVPVLLFENNDLIGRLGKLITDAENAASSLRTRTRRIAKLYLASGSESPGGSQPDPADVTRIADTLDPRPAFWSRMESHFYKLLENLPNDWDSSEDDWKPDEKQAATQEWRVSVKQEAQNALEESVRSLGTTSRAIQAIARVRLSLFDYDLDPELSKNRKQNKTKGGTTG